MKSANVEEADIRAVAIHGGMEGGSHAWFEIFSLESQHNAIF